MNLDLSFRVTIVHQTRTSLVKVSTFMGRLFFFLLVPTYVLIVTSSSGPVPGTYQDFWRMLWQENVTTVVMLTGLVEQGRVRNVSLFFHHLSCLVDLFGGKCAIHKSTKWDLGTLPSV